MFNHFTAEQIGQFEDLVDIIKRLYVSRRTNYTHVVKDVIRANHKLQEDYTDQPQVRLIVLVFNYCPIVFSC
jgi:hypothetical protein